MKKISVLFIMLCTPFFITKGLSIIFIGDLIHSFIIGTLGLSLIIYGLYLLYNNIYYHIGLFIIFIMLLLSSLIDAISYYKMRLPINFIFLQHFNTASLSFITAAEVISLLGILTTNIGLALVIILLYKSRNDIKKTNLIIKLTIIVIGVYCLYNYSSALKDNFNIIKRCYCKKVLPKHNNEMYELVGIKPSNVDYNSLDSIKGKNLLLIYLESIEDTFTNNELFPDLTPNINRLKKDSILFNNIYESHCANYSFGGLYSSISGSYLVSEQFLNLIHINTDTKINLNLGSKLLSVPKILNKLNYNQSFIYCGNLSAGQVDIYLKSQKYDELIDHKLKNNRTYYDNELFDFTYDKIIKLSESNQPFNITIFTADTHTPEITDDSWSKYDYKKVKDLSKYDPSLTAVKHTDESLGVFINKLKRTYAWENLVVIIMTDHLSREITSTPILNKGDRKLLVMALNAGEAKNIKTHGKTFDIAPTILDLMGVTHNYEFPLGESLLRSNHNTKRLNDDSVTQEEALTYYLKVKG